jgi:hypothetical protein
MAISVNVSSAVAIGSKDDLKTWIAEEVDRDLSEITDNLDKWILMAEARFNRDLRCSEMERSIFGYATAEDMPLPDDYLAMRAIYIEGSPDRPLRGLAPSAIRQEFDGTAGTPVAYTLIADSLRLVPPPSDNVLLSMDYWAKIEALTTNNPSNWLLEAHPDAYVTAVLFHYYRWSQNREAAVDANQLCELLIAKINRSSRNDRFGAGPLVPNAVVQVRNAKC